MAVSLFPSLRAKSGWTTSERGQFARIERLLETSGFAVDVEHGVSDEGDPWCVFCSRLTGDVIIHAARIDGRVMIDSAVLPRPIEGVSFQRCAERFFEDCRLPPPALEQGGAVRLHPGAMLASLFVTIVLYAHATSGRSLFEGPAVDAEEEGAPQGTAGLLAIRLKAIAQQAIDYAAQDQGPVQGQAPAHAQAAAGSAHGASLAVIPAGMALAVLAIAQDIAAVMRLDVADAEGAGGDGEDAAQIAALGEAAEREAAHLAAASLGAGEAGPRESESEVDKTDGSEDGALAEALAAVAEMMAAVSTAAPAAAVADRAGATDAFAVQAVTAGLALPDVIGLAPVDEAALPESDASAERLDIGDLLDAFLSGTMFTTDNVILSLGGDLQTLEVIRLDGDGSDLGALVMAAIAEVSVPSEDENLFGEEDTASAVVSVADAGPVTTQDTVDIDRDRIALAENDGFDFYRAETSPGALPSPLDLRPGTVAPPLSPPGGAAAPARPALPEIPVAEAIDRGQLNDYVARFVEMVDEVAPATAGDMILFVQSGLDSTIGSDKLRVEVFEVEDTTVTFIGTEWDFHGFV